MSTKHFVSFAATFFPSFYPLPAYAQQAQQPPWDWAGPWPMWNGWIGFSWIFPLCMLFMAIICLAMFFRGHGSRVGCRHWGPCRMVDRPSDQDRSASDSTCTARQILNERFAKGDIQRQEYEEKIATIRSNEQH